VAAELLARQGYADIGNVQGGMIAWRRAGLPTR
jgi:rhodanese-related sulfurtransferase